MVECLPQPLQTDPVSLIPLFGNPGSALPNGVSIHLFGSTECRLKRSNASLPVTPSYT